MNRIKTAQELVAMAKELMGVEFATEKEKRTYLQEHPDADKSKMQVRPDKVNKERREREKK